METKNLAELYDAPPVSWDRITARLDQGFTQAPGTGGPDRHTCWLATLNADGTPHVTGVGADWHDGAFWFSTAETSRKGHNLALDPRCSLSLATLEFDLTIEGTADRVTDPAEVAGYVERATAGGWPARVDESGIAITADYSAQSAGPPPWHVYRITARTAVAVETVDPGGASRWTF